MVFQAVIPKMSTDPNKGEFNFNKNLKIDGNLTLYGSLIIDVTDASADFIDINGTVSIDYGKLIIKTHENLNLLDDWVQTILTAENIDGNFTEYSDASNAYDFLIGYNDNNITLKAVKLDTNGTVPNPPDDIDGTDSEEGEIIDFVTPASLCLTNAVNSILYMSQMQEITA
ncbi:MAG: hypothetical protein JRJ49_03545 [Deltaproteobacteria bacterium]|nr:hypothetical protein [Deltaproteobacteria bacterium]